VTSIGGGDISSILGFDHIAISRRNVLPPSRLRHSFG
jgi:hypothetical protein